MKLAGMPLKDIVDVYIQRNPSQFPKDPRSKECRAAKLKQADLMKKKLKRLQQHINKTLGDKP